jgi:hypothetical protein
MRELLLVKRCWPGSAKLARFFLMSYNREVVEQLCACGIVLGGADHVDQGSDENTRTR